MHNYLMIITKEATAYVDMGEITEHSLYDINGPRRPKHTLHIEGSVSQDAKSSYDTIVDIMRCNKQREVIMVCGCEMVHYPVSCIKNMTISLEVGEPYFIPSLYRPANITIEIDTDGERELDQNRFNALVNGIGLGAWEAARVSLTNNPKSG